MNLMQLVRDGLKRNGYDGLFVEDGCACRLDDLAPCACMTEACQPGVIIDREFCDHCTPSHPCAFHMGQKRESVDGKDDPLRGCIAVMLWLTIAIVFIIACIFGVQWNGVFS